MTNNHTFFHQYLQVSRMFTKKLNETLAQYDLYHSQWSIVYFLKEYGPSTLVEIGSYLNVEKPTVTRTVNRLEKRQLIEQVLSPNKREKRIQLTRAGEEIYKICREEADHFEMQVIGDLTDEEKNIAFKILSKLQEQLKK